MRSERGAEEGNEKLLSTNPMSRREEYAKEAREFSFGRQRMLP